MQHTYKHWILRLANVVAFATLQLAALTACNETAAVPPGDAPVDPTDPTTNDPQSPTDGGVVGDAEEVLPTGTPAANEVRINETKRIQVLDGVGTNANSFPFANDIEYQWDAVKDVFDEIDVAYVRLASWFGNWEPTNDDGDPSTTNWDAFDPTGLIQNHDVGFAQYLTERDIAVELGVWMTSAWLGTDTIPASNFPELGESIATYLTNMEDNGVPMAITEVQNEPGINAMIKYPSPEALVEAGNAVLDALDAAGHEDVMLHGPNYHAPDQDAAHWAEVWMADDRLRERTAALSYHTWWRDDFESYDRLRQIAEENDKPVWATEIGYCALPAGCGNGHFLLPETWDTAWDYAMSYYRALAWSHASRLYHWTLVGFDGAVNPGTGERYPSFYAMKHFANYIEPGSRMLEVASGDDEVLALAFLLPSGERTVILMNTAASEKSIDLGSVEGRGQSVTEAVTTTEGSYEADTEIVDAEGAVSATLPPESITSIRLAP